MTDIVERLRIPLTGDIRDDGSLGLINSEREEAAAEIERLRAGGCARDQRLTQYCAELTEAVMAEREACAILADERGAVTVAIAIRARG